MPLSLHLTAGAVAQLLGARLVGEDSALAHLGSLESADSGDLSFLDEGTRPRRAFASRAGALLCPPELEAALPGRTLLVHPAPRLALHALLSGPCTPPPLPDTWLSEEEVVARFGQGARGAHVSAASQVASDCALSPGAVIEAGVTVAEGCSVGPGAVLHRGTVLDRNCHVGALSVIGSQGFGLVAGAGGYAPLPHHAGVHLHPDVRIGPQCNLAAGLLDPTTVGTGCRIDAQVQVGHNGRIGAHTRIAAQVGLSGSVTLGEDCLVGGQAGFADHVRLGEGCVVAARAGVTRSWPAGTQLGGFPAQPLSQWRRECVRSRAFFSRLDLPGAPGPI